MDENELTDAERAVAEQHNPEALRDYDGRRDQNFEPPGSAPKRTPTSQDTAPEDAQAERMRLSKILADPSREAVLNAGFKNRGEAIDRLDELSQAASGVSNDDKQASADDDFAPKNVADYTGLDAVATRAGSLTEGAHEDMQELKSTLFEHGVSPDVARAIWQTGPEYFSISDEAHYAKCETAVNIIRGQPDGAKTLADANRFVQSLGRSPVMQQAALVAMMTPLGLKELGRLGRRMQRA